MKQVLAFGVFDLLHPGHLHYLNRASKLGDRLSVLLARDSNLKRNLIFEEEERRQLVAALEMVDDTFLGYVPADTERVIRERRPQVIALGYDQDRQPVVDVLKKLELEIEIVNIDSYQEETYSASKFKRRLSRKLD